MCGGQSLRYQLPKGKRKTARRPYQSFLVLADPRLQAGALVQKVPNDVFQHPCGAQHRLRLKDGARFKERYGADSQEDEGPDRDGQGGRVFGGKEARLVDQVAESLKLCRVELCSAPAISDSGVDAWTYVSSVALEYFADPVPATRSSSLSRSRRRIRGANLVLSPFSVQQRRQNLEQVRGAVAAWLVPW